jgi:ABC-type nitrate/sulfonate/bicarbonate transport system substrate-binding protein
MEITLALDWTPNTNHTGFYVALAEGWYHAAGLDVTIVPADADAYATTPAKKVATGAATFGIAPSESVVSFHTLPDRPPLVAVATILQHDTSAIVTLTSSGRDRPARLDGCRYASYNARFEDAIVAQLIRNDGGRGAFESITPPKLGIWNTLLTGEADATWVFMAWEGIAAERQGIDLHVFRLDDYGVPYGYTPVLLAHPATLHGQPDAVRAFVQASARGFAFAAANADLAANMLMATANHPTLDDPEFVRASQHAVGGAYLADERWGVMARERWQAFVDWLGAQRILTDIAGRPLPTHALNVDALFSNAFLAES